MNANLYSRRSAVVSDSRVQEVIPNQLDIDRTNGYLEELVTIALKYRIEERTCFAIANVRAHGNVHPCYMSSVSIHIIHQ
jgi:hypothetical protein